MKAKFSDFSKVKEKYLQFIRSQEVPGELFKDKLGQLNNFYIPISKMIYRNYSKNKRTKIIGLAGGQGSGKSTISKILKIILKEKFNLETVIFSIDDFYKTLKDREKMSKNISKLFLTRGVPGTHDTRMLLYCLAKNTKKTSHILNENNFTSEDCILIIRTRKGKAIAIAGKKLTPIKK